MLDLAAPKVRIKVETALAVEKIESVAFSDGLEPEQLLSLVKLGTSGKYGEPINVRCPSRCCTADQLACDWLFALVDHDHLINFR